MDTDKVVITIITEMQACMEKIKDLKDNTEGLDKRCLAIACTELETAMLWLANSRQ